MIPTELKMQPIIHLESKAGYFPYPHPALRSKCIVGCIFNSVGFIIIRESLCRIIIMNLLGIRMSTQDIAPLSGDKKYRRLKTLIQLYAGYFTRYNEPGGIENDKSAQ
jgi:hypothetical protein